MQKWQELTHRYRYTEWPKISENWVIYDSLIVDLTHLNFTYLYC